MSTCAWHPPHQVCKDCSPEQVQYAKELQAAMLSHQGGAVSKCERCGGDLEIGRRDRPAYAHRESDCIVALVSARDASLALADETSAKLQEAEKHLAIVDEDLRTFSIAERKLRIELNREQAKLADARGRIAHIEQLASFKRADRAERRLTVAVEALREALPVMAQIAISVGYVLAKPSGGQAAIKDVSEKWPPCSTCESAADHYEHCRQICEQIDKALTSFESEES